MTVSKARNGSMSQMNVGEVEKRFLVLIALRINLKKLSTGGTFLKELAVG